MSSRESLPERILEVLSIVTPSMPHEDVARLHTAVRNLASCVLEFDSVCGKDASLVFSVVSKSRDGKVGMGCVTCRNEESPVDTDLALSEAMVGLLNAATNETSVLAAGVSHSKSPFALLVGAIIKTFKVRVLQRRRPRVKE